MRRSPLAWGTAGRPAPWRRQQPKKAPAKKADHEKAATRQRAPAAACAATDDISSRHRRCRQRRAGRGDGADAGRRGVSGAGSRADAAKSTVTNVIDDPAVSLQRFDLLDLQPYTQEKVYATTASKDFHLFYVGRDDVHDILKHVLSRVSVSLYLNMFGFDDDELNDILMKIALDATITMLVTLDKSQAGGKHEKALLDADRQHNLALFNTHFVTKTHVQEFVIGQSATHQISHTKGFVADGRVAGEGSTNWSASGEGTFVVKGKRRRRRIQGAEQHPVDHHRPGHDQPLLGRTGRRAYDRAEAGRGCQGGGERTLESQSRQAAVRWPNPRCRIPR